MNEQEKNLERQKKDARDRELDRFWDVDDLIPARRAPIYSSNTETAEITLEPVAKVQKATEAQRVPERNDQPERHFIPPHTAEEEKRAALADEEYESQSALIRKVRLYRHKNAYPYYEAFAKDAARLYRVEGKECARVPFFSYVPQYSQMSVGQLEWYLWWRENFRAERLLDTDYSYLLLYAFEAINLSDRAPAAQMQKLLARLWLGYRETFRQLDSYLPEWICDMGLIHRLPPPRECAGLSAAMAHCALREFYVCCEGADEYVRALLAFCSNYDYRKSKFYTAENRALFDSTVTEVLRFVTEAMSGDGKLFSAARMDDSKMIRDAYTGAICSYRIKRKIEVEYCSFSRSHELRFLIGDVVKYTENRIRASLGIRSRLSVYALPTSVKELLDSCLDRILPQRRASAQPKKEELAAYEKLYDLPSKPLSFAAAAEIEALSWSTTQKLVEAFEESEQKAAEPVSLPKEEPKAERKETANLEASQEGDPLLLALRPYLAFLRAAMEKDAVRQRDIAQGLSKLLDALADEINDLAAEYMGDIILEENGGFYTVIEDYTDVVQAMLDTAEGKEE